MQASWTNPLTNVILLEAGLAVNRQLYDFSQHRYYTPNPDIPRVVEFGATVGADDLVSQINNSATIFGVPSGPWADGIGGAAEQRDLNDLRPRASMSYVTGSHAAKFGYDGGYFAQTRKNRTGNTRLEYRYDTPLGPTADEPGPNLRQRAQSGCIAVWQHEPLLPERPVQPGAPSGAHARHD